MKVAILNTYPHGGAGTAAFRLAEALNSAAHEAIMLTRQPGNSPLIQSVKNSLQNRLPFLAERLSFLPFERDKSVRFSFSPANFGLDLSKNSIVKQADVIHLHWINQGFISIEQLEKLANLNKPIVWTMHDMWPFTGGCHYSGDCLNFKTGCGNCPYLKSPSATDLSARIIARKKKYWPKNIRFVTCSNWLAGVARSSELLKNQSIQAIPNPIDTHFWKPFSSEERAAERAKLGISPDKKVLLFVAMNTQETRKGWAYLKTALDILNTQLVDNQLEILILGKAPAENLAALPFPTRPLGLISDPAEMRRFYGIADVFVIPSLEDNLPNTVMESLACGTPVAGFYTGGIPEMVGHLSEGFIAPPRDSKQLADGINWVISDNNRLEKLRINCVKKVADNYSYEKVAQQYLRVYQSV